MITIHKTHAFICMFLLFFCGYTESQTPILEVLKKYKNFLEKGTYEAFAANQEKPLSRYYTFLQAFEHFHKINGITVVELGTTRSFVHGGLPGCNTSDIRYWTPNNPKNWDWGAGCFTRLAAECLIPFGATIHTIDISKEHISRCHVITKDFHNHIHYHVMSSVKFLSTYQGKIDLLYLDTGDMTPIEPTAQLQLDEAKIIVQRNLVSSRGIILIDDVKSPVPKLFGDTSELGKAKYSLPYLLKHGFRVKTAGYQVLLERKTNIIM